MLKPLSLKAAPHDLLWVPASLRRAVPRPLQHGQAQVGGRSCGKGALSGATEWQAPLCTSTQAFLCTTKHTDVTSAKRAGTSSAWVNSGAPPPASIPLAGAPAGAWGGSSSRVYEEPAPTFTSDDVRGPSHLLHDVADPNP